MGNRFSLGRKPAQQEDTQAAGNDKENDPEYWRDQARQHAQRRNGFYERSQAAYQQHNGAEAKALSLEGKKETQLMEEANRKASEAAFKLNNVSAEENVIDLHGLYVSEAERVRLGFHIARPLQACNVCITACIFLEYSGQALQVLVWLSSAAHGQIQLSHWHIAAGMASQSSCSCTQSKTNSGRLHLYSKLHRTNTAHTCCLHQDSIRGIGWSVKGLHNLQVVSKRVAQARKQRSDHLVCTPDQRFLACHLRDSLECTLCDWPCDDQGLAAAKFVGLIGT